MRSSVAILVLLNATMLWFVWVCSTDHRPLAATFTALCALAGNVPGAFAYGKYRGERAERERERGGR